ncbi:DUF433 domain-containing protein [Parafilimonas sp.]|uniref:DUF433 domain-containing protein n=1 Tax=Parafilimonas sp. TaxID=1969739 RepID=UPI003F7E4464
MNWKAYITSDISVLNGKPVIKGTRLSVDFILERLADGWSEEMLLKNYPSLSADSLKAVFAYAHDCLKDGLLYDNKLV